MNRTSLYCFVLATAFGLAACSAGNDADDSAATADGTPTPAAAPVAAADDNHAAEFLTEAMKGDNGEVRVGQLALDKGTSQGVKDFGQMLLTDHGKHKDQVAQVASGMGVGATDATTPEADSVYAKLQALSGAEFDKQFVAAMIEDHQKDIAKYEQEAASGDPAPVTGLATQTLPTLKHHLETAQSLR